MNTELARQQMVEQQIRTWDVFDADVLHAFGAVSREQFVPAGLQDAAYADAEIPLAHKQCMLRPSIAGRLLQSLGIQEGDDVLEIGTGTGYLTNCLAQLAGTVTSIDIYEDFVTAARARLADAGAQNVTLHCMDALAELPQGEYDAIAVTGSVATVAEQFIHALKPGGRLFIVTGSAPVMTATLITRTPDDEIVSQELFETNIPALVSNDAPAEFLF